MSIAQINLFHKQGVETERTISRINALEHLKLEYGTKEAGEPAEVEPEIDYDSDDWFDNMFSNPPQNIREVKIGT